MLAWRMVRGDIMRTIDGAYHFSPTRRRRHRGALRPGHRAGRAAARLRQAPRRGAHPQHRARAEGPRRVRDAGVAVGIDVGGTKCLGVVARRRRRASSTSTAARRRNGADALDRDARRASPRELGAAATRSASACPGLVNRDGRAAAPRRTSSTSASCRRRARGCAEPAGHRTSPSTTTPPCAALAEWRHGAGRGVDDIVLVTLGTGIGGGFVLGGALQRGANGFAGEIGHMIVDPDGPPCPCGRRGCWERYASGSGLGHLARQAARWPTGRRRAAGGVDDVRGEDVPTRPHGGDAGARGHRRVRRLGGARARQPHQPVRSGVHRARRRARRPTPTCSCRRSRRCVRRPAVRAGACARSPTSRSPSSASTPAAIGAALLGAGLAG